MEDSKFYYKIMIDCVANDSVDIRCGGPQYLGFDFYVKVGRQTKIVQIQEWIKEQLFANNIPCIRIVHKQIEDLIFGSGPNKGKSKYKYWDKEMMLEEISKYKDGKGF